MTERPFHSKVFIAPVLIFLMTQPLSAEPAKPTFDISGNERTRTAYITELAEACLQEHNELLFGDRDQLLLLDQCLLNSKLFATVKSSAEENRIRIAVEEKWTLIPAPFFQSSGSTRKAGLILFETNFLGQGLTLALGATASNKGNGFFGFFTNPSILGSRFFSQLSYRKESNIYELREDRKITDALLEKNSGGSFGLGYKFPWINLSVQYSRTEKRFDPHQFYAVPLAYENDALGATLEYDRRDYKLYFSDGFFFRGRYSETLNDEAQVETLRSSSAIASWQHDVYADHALFLQYNAAKSTGGRLTDIERVGTGKGFRGIETRTAWAESYQTQTAEYQLPIRDFEKGTLTWALFVDHGHLQNRGGKNSEVDYTAGGVGIYFYLKRLALPGLGLEYGTNSEYQQSFVNFSVGLSI